MTARKKAADGEDLAQASDVQTVEDAEAQEPLLDTADEAASEEVPTGGDADMVLAQTPDEVATQLANPAGEHLGFAEGYERLVPPDLDPTRRVNEVRPEDQFIIPADRPEDE